MSSGRTDRYTQYLRHPARLLAFAALLVVLAFTLACESEGDSAGTSDRTTEPTPTATPTPTPTPSPTPETAAPTGGGPPPPVDQVLIEELLAPLPAGFFIAGFLDIAALSQDPDLQALLEQEDVLDAFGPAGAAIQSQLTSAVVAGGGEGFIGVMRGPLVIPDLIELLKLLGVAVETRTSGEFEVVALTVDTPLLELSLALTTLDEETFIFARGPTEGVNPSGLLVSALETLSGERPGFVSEEGVMQLLEAGLPPGLAITISKGCGEFGQTPGCQAWAVGFAREGDSAMMRGKLSFESAEIAQAALPMVQQTLAEDADFSGEATVQGSLVLIEGTVPRDRLAEGPG